MGKASISYNNTISFLLGAIDYEKISKYKYDSSSFNLNRMEQLMNITGNPHHGLKTVHVAGTKGKGSTSNMIAAILMGTGLKVGLFTSPHLINLEERIKINGKDISHYALSKVTDALRPYVENERKKDLYSSSTFFEILTAVALLYFKNEDVDVAVMETGLGGRLDSTNIIDPLVSVITSIGFDHTDKLGTTLVEIANEKAGIIKDNRPVVSSCQKDEVLRVINETCEKKNSNLLVVGRDIIIKNGRPSNSFKKQLNDTGNNAFGSLCDIITDKNNYNDIFIPVLGAHQLVNCACAIGAVEIALNAMENCKLKNEINVKRNSLTKVTCPGRVEIIRKEPFIIVDSAHTVESIKALKETISEYINPEKITLLFGIFQDKDVEAILNEIIPFVDDVIFTTTNNTRSAKPEDLVKMHEKLFKNRCYSTDNINEGLQIAIKITDKSNLICVTGSTYLAGAIKEIIGKGI